MTLFRKNLFLRRSILLPVRCKRYIFYSLQALFKINILIVLLFAALFCANALFLPERAEGKEISVELVWKLDQAGWVEIDASGNYLLCAAGQENVPFLSGDKLCLGWGGWAPVWSVNYNDYKILRSPELKLIAEGGDGLTIRTPDGKNAVYRGGLEISWAGDHWKLINNVDLEDYLKGVVPMEMGNEWAAQGMEALKAQAVAARTYAVQHTQGGKMITDSPDRDQAYGGKLVEGQASDAVVATKGEFLADSGTGQPISALYSAHNGGFSEETENVWGGDDPHYVTKSDPYSLGVGGAVAQWNFQISAAALGKAFGLGPVRDLKLDKDTSGRVKKVRMTDWLGNAVTISGSKFVQKFYPFGQPVSSTAFLGSLFEAKLVPTSGQAVPSYTESLNRPVTVGGILNSALKQNGPLLGRIVSSDQGVQQATQPYGLYVFSGRGWGHGVGMSQWGAYHMAQEGLNYRDILGFYYEHTQVKQAGS